LSEKPERLALRIVDLSCTSCAKVIRGELMKRNGILEVKTNPIMNEIYVDYESGSVSPEEIEGVVRKSGYKGRKGAWHEMMLGLFAVWVEFHDYSLR
jgi:copper chaperone CopZ